MNQLLRYVTEQGLNTTIYNILFSVSFLIVMVYTLTCAGKHKIPRGKAVALIVLTYAVSMMWMFTMCWIENGFKGWGGNNIVRIFVWIPVIAWPITKLLKLDFMRSCDFLSLGAPLIQVNHWGCIFAGCCHGYPCSWGVYNPMLDENAFPIQFVESFAALAVVIIVARHMKKRNYEPDGLAYPLMLMLFGYSRFLLEFLRDNDKVFFGVSTLALHALFMALVGTATYFTIKERNEKQKRIGGKQRK